ncbi:polysaccharide deacetylase family protein [Oceanobacillus saliphilus]|uniref:polysaccharide deacetylase family protein n=1 Tax=Oceanobacillus saliphilus TaxID=2925834 RepID=UPI00201D9C2A|nr:polysaccharide deacetylase family protein [Oceanobacillus saliphilus]
MRKNLFLVLTGLILVILTGCGRTIAETEKDVLKSTNLIEETNAEGKPNRKLADTYDVVYTLDEVMTLVFEQILPVDETIQLLDMLDKYEIKATFFGSSEQLEMNPEAAEEIIKRGYQIENHAFYEMDLKELDYDDVYRLIKETNDIIETITGQQAKYVYVNSKKEYDDIHAVADEFAMSGVINYSSKINFSDPEDERKIREEMRNAIARGGILAMNPDHMNAIPYLMEAVDEVDYNFVLLDDLIDLDQGRKPFAEIPGADAIQVNPNMEGIEPFLHYQEKTDRREVALTFDDWASEAVVLEVLDILDKYNIQSTFYLKAKTIHKNPNLARLLIERGHEVANHTYSHLDSTTISPEELQNDVYKAHKIITEAIQEQPTLYFRPPFGRIDDQSAQAIAAMGFQALGMYDISSYDWNSEYSKEDVINRVMTNVQPGSVIVMHILNDIHTPGVLEDVILSLQAEGYEFVLTSDWIE